jgi:hypothetical protein
VACRGAATGTDQPGAAAMVDADPLRGSIDAADHMELVGHDASLGQDGLDSFAVGPVTVHHDGLDVASDLVGHRREATVDRPLTVSLG